MGGSEAIISALQRGLEKQGGRLLLRAHVDQIVVEGGRAAGVALRPRRGGSVESTVDEDAGHAAAGAGGGAAGPEVVRARMGVISNASVW